MDAAYKLRNDATTGSRNLLEMTKVFEEELMHIENDSKATEGQKAYTRNLLERGMMTAVSLMFQQGAGLDAWHNMDSLNTYAKNAISNASVATSGMSNKTKSVVFAGLDDALSHIQGRVNFRTYHEAAMNHIQQYGNLSKDSLKALTARIDNQNRQIRDSYKAMLEEALNQVKQWQPTITLPEVGISNDEEALLNILNEEDAPESSDTDEIAEDDLSAPNEQDTSLGNKGYQSVDYSV